MKRESFPTRRVLTTFFIMALATTAGALEQPKWTACGWGGGGWYWSAAFDPVNPNVLYLGGDVDGIWKSTDAGKSWAFVNKGLSNYGVYSLAVAPSDGKTLYALTENGVCASFDAAATWTPCKDTARSALGIVASRGGSIHALAVDPRAPRTVYAGGRNGRAAKSTDGGRTWQTMDYLSARQPAAGERAEPLSGKGYGRLTIAMKDGDWGNYVRIQKFLSQTGEDWKGADKISAKVFLPKDVPEGLMATLVVQSGNWVWKEGPMLKLKPGWNTLEYPLSTFTDPHHVNMVHFVVRTWNGKGYLGDLGIDACVVSGPTGRVRVLGEWDGADAEGWVVSPDANTKAVTKAIVASSAPRTPPPGGPVGTIAVSGTNPSLVFLCQEKYGLFRSEDAGATWQHVVGAPAGAHTVVWAGRKAPTTWFGAFKSDVCRSRDDGRTWTPLKAPVDTDCAVRDIVVDPRTAKTLHAIVGSGFKGYIATSRDGGATWTKNQRVTPDFAANPTLPKDGSRAQMSGLENLALSPANPDRLFMAGNWVPCISDDAGRTWRESAKGADITCFHDIRHLGAATYGAAMDEGSFRTLDGGRTWSALCPLRWTAGLSGHHWRILPQKLANGKTRIISTVSPWAHGHDFPVKVVVSDDDGKTFVEAKGLPDYRTHANTMWGEGHGRALCADPKNPDIIYLGIDGDPEKGNAGGGVFKSVDGGHTFAQLPNQPGSRRMFYGLAVDPTNSKRLVWGAGGEKSGVYVSEDAGATWTKAQGPQDWIFNVEVSPKGTIYAGGNQLWRSDDHGKSFRPVTAFKDVCVCGIAVDPVNENRVWASATTWSGDASANCGVFESRDGGKTWTDISGDIAYPKPLVLRYNATTKRLWAAGPAAFRLPR